MIYFVFQLFPDDSKTEVRYINLGDKFDFFVARKYVMRFSIWYHLYNLKNVFFCVFWIVQMVPNRAKHHR